MSKSVKIVCLLGLVIFTSLIIGSNNYSKCKKIINTDTLKVVYYDTIAYVMPIAKDSVIIRRVKVLVPQESQDTFKNNNDNAYAYSDIDNVHDSISVDIPITQKCYKDSLYEAWISGYLSTLDSIKIFPPIEVVTITKKGVQRRWHIGMTAGVGVGLCEKKTEPFVGIGLTYNLW